MCVFVKHSYLEHHEASALCQGVSGLPLTAAGKLRHNILYSPCKVQLAQSRKRLLNFSVIFFLSFVDNGKQRTQKKNK